MKRYLLPALVLLATITAVDVLGQGPLTPLMNLRGRTDAGGYLITTGAAYTAPDGPLTALANLRGRTDANGYLITTSSPTGTANFGYFADGAVGTPSIAFSSNTNTGLYKSATNTIAFATGGGLAMTIGANITAASTVNIISTGTTFGALGSPANGSMIFCSDCTVTTPATCPATKASCVCAGSGSGAMAVRLNGSWDCALFQ